MGSEKVKELQTDIDQSLIQEIVPRIKGVTQPERVILFGSGVTGKMTQDSDIDLLVVERGVADTRQEALRIRRALRGLPFPFDVVVISHDRFEETRGIIGGIAWPATRYGKVIYEVA